MIIRSRPGGFLCRLRPIWRPTGLSVWSSCGHFPFLDLARGCSRRSSVLPCEPVCSGSHLYPWPGRVGLASTPPPTTSPWKSPQQSPEGSRWTACPLLAACWDPRAHNCPQVCESAGVLRKFQHPPQGGSERCSEVRLEPQAGRWPSPFPAPRHLLLDALTAPHHLCQVTSEAAPRPLPSG